MRDFTALTYICGTASFPARRGSLRPPSSFSRLIDMPDHQRHRWTSWLSFSAAEPLMHFISSRGSAAVIKHLLQWHLTRRSWINGSLACFFLRGGYFTIFTLFIKSLWRHIYQETSGILWVAAAKACKKRIIFKGELGLQPSLFLLSAHKILIAECVYSAFEYVNMKIKADLSFFKLWPFLVFHNHYAVCEWDTAIWNTYEWDLTQGWHESHFYFVELHKCFVSVLN